MTPAGRAPLAPDRFLRWLWSTYPQIVRVHGYTGFVAPTLDSLLWDMQLGIPEYTMADLRRLLVRMAALVRYNQRLNKDPFTVKLNDTRRMRRLQCESAA